jgi:hypothetical protein
MHNTHSCSGTKHVKDVNAVKQGIVWSIELGCQICGSLPDLKNRNKYYSTNIDWASNDKRKHGLAANNSEIRHGIVVTEVQQNAQKLNTHLGI